ncbi:MAG TPA: hypothetical protein VF240_08060 [Pyrinomonadaceae bacterium]
MKSAKHLKIFSAVALAVLLLLAPLASAQRRRARAPRRAASTRAAQKPAARAQQPPQPQPTPAAAGVRRQPARTAVPPVVREAEDERGATEIDLPLEEVVAAEGYALYIELRALGHLVRTKELTELIELVRLVMVGSEARQVSEYIDFFTANAEQLNDVNAYTLMMPTRAGLPQFVGAYQFPSVEVAKNFEPKARAVMQKYERAYREVFPTPNPAEPTGATTTVAEAGKQGAGAATPATPDPKIVVKRYGRLILMSGEPFTLKSLKGKDEPPLTHNTRFQTLRSRLSSEPVFLYFDVKLLDKSEAADRERREQAQKEQETLNGSGPGQAAAQEEEAERRMREVMAQAEAEAQIAEAARESGPAEEGEEEGEGDPEMMAPPEVAVESSAVTVETTPSPTLSGRMEGGQAGGDDGAAAGRGGEFMLSMLFGMGMSGASRWPEAVGAALALERDTFVIRALLLNSAGAQLHPVPFLPVFISGPQLTPQAASLAPANTDIYVSASLDLAQMYDRMLASMDESFSREAQAREATGEKMSDERAGNKISDERPDKAEATIAAAEKLLGFKIKGDFLPALGNEVAVSVPLKWVMGESGHNHGYRPEAKDERQGAVVLVSLNNAEAMRRMLPRVLEVMGLKPLTAAEQKVSHGGVDIHVYGSLAVAYIGNFVALSSEVPAMKRLIDSGSSQGALAADEAFRTATSWSPRQKLAEVYVSRALADSLLTEVTKWVDPKDAEVQQMLARLNIRPAPASYAATDEGGMLLHELRLPTAIVKYFAAGAMLETKTGPVKRGETSALSTLTMIRHMQQAHKDGKGKGSYATLDELAAPPARRASRHGAEWEHPLSKLALEKQEYRFELTAAGDKYAVTATPREFGKNGRRSFYMDETGIIRATERAGEPATANDPPVD